MSSETPCPGVPNKCDFSKNLITQVLDGQPTLERVSRARIELEHCIACVQILEVEIRFKMAMGQACRESAPPALQIRITETLQRINLDEVNIQDF